MSHQSVAPAVEEMTRYLIVECLRQTGAELDRLWSQAAERGRDDAIQLGEAAQGVHRALLALKSA